MSKIRDIMARKRAEANKPITKLPVTPPLAIRVGDTDTILTAAQANAAAIKFKADFPAISLAAPNLAPQIMIDPTPESIEQELDASVAAAPRISLAERLANLALIKSQSLLEANAELNKGAEHKLVSKLATNKPEPEEPDIILDLPTKSLIPTALVQRGKDQITFEDLNTEQRKAVTLAREGVPFCLIGSAGSGKTTTTREIALELDASGEICEIGESTKVLQSNSPSIVFVSFTNQAVSNIRQAVPDKFKDNCLTIHKLLEYEPVFFDIWDPLSHEMKPTMRYEPARGIHNPIVGITVCVVEEAGSVGVALHDNLTAALGPDVIYIYLGDLNQLPPVFDDAILGFKLLELPVVELTRSYRTDSTSPIRELAYKILEGKPLSDKQVRELGVKGELDFVQFKDRVDWEHAIPQIGKHFQNLVQQEHNIAGSGFDYNTDVILIPFNKQLGSIELNAYIAQKLAELHEVPTYEVIVGFIKKYYAVGDIIYHAKQRFTIVAIDKNEAYAGKAPTPASIELDRWGNTDDEELAVQLAMDNAALSADDILEKLASENMATENSTSFRQASHKFVLEPVAGDPIPITISDCAAINEFYLAYALTVHKSQGSEWGKVFCIFHHSHAVMLKREILYTAITRARKQCVIYFSGGAKRPSDSVFHKGIVRQYIKGNTLEDKLDFFRGKLKVEAMKRELKRVKDNVGAVFTRTNVDLDAEATKKLLYSMTHNLNTED